MSFVAASSAFAAVVTPRLAGVFGPFLALPSGESLDYSQGRNMRFSKVGVFLLLRIPAKILLY